MIPTESKILQAERRGFGAIKNPRSQEEIEALKWEVAAVTWGFFQEREIVTFLIIPSMIPTNLEAWRLGFVCFW